MNHRTFVIRLESAAASPASREEGIVPMICIAFLMLAFLLLTATLDIQREENIALPGSHAHEKTGASTSLYIRMDGTPEFGDLSGQEAIHAFSVQPAPSRILADRDLEAVHLARILAELRDIGFTEAILAVRAR